MKRSNEECHVPNYCTLKTIHEDCYVPTEVVTTDTTAEEEEEANIPGMPQKKFYRSRAHCNPVSKLLV